MNTLSLTIPKTGHLYPSERNLLRHWLDYYIRTGYEPSNNYLATLEGVPKQSVSSRMCRPSVKRLFAFPYGPQGGRRLPPGVDAAWREELGPLERTKKDINADAAGHRRCADCGQDTSYAQTWNRNACVDCRLVKEDPERLARIRLYASRAARLQPLFCRGRK